MHVDLPGQPVNFKQTCDNVIEVRILADSTDRTLQCILRQNRPFRRVKRRLTVESGDMMSAVMKGRLIVTAAIH